MELIKLNPQIGDKFIPKNIIKSFEQFKNKTWTIINILPREYVRMAPNILLDGTQAKRKGKEGKEYFIAEYGDLRTVFLDRDIKEWM